MELPFSESQFLDVFGAYNGALSPAVIALWIVTAAVAVAWLRGKASSRWVFALLAIHWAWSGAVYHLRFFTRINPAARIFGAMFMIQAITLAFDAFRPRVRFPAPRSWRDAAALFFVAYSLAYPFLGLLSGLAYPRMPLFAVPCPTTLLTAGLLLAASPRVPRSLLFIPLLWSVIASTAAFVLGIYADLALVAAAVALALNAAMPRREMTRQPVGS